MSRSAIPGLVLELINSGVIVLNANSEIVSWNEWMADHSGLSEQDVMGQVIYQVVPEIKGSRIERAIKKALEFNCPSILSAKLIDASFPLFRQQIIGRGDQERLRQSILIKPFELEEGGQHCVISIVDISTAERREQALRNQTDLLNKVVNELKDKDYELSMLFQNTQNGILIFDAQGVIQKVNPSVRRIAGDKHKQFVGQNVALFIEKMGGSAGSFEIERVERLVQEQDTEIESRFIVSQEKAVDIAFSVNKIPQFDRSPERYFVFFHDIGIQKEAERRLVQMAKFDNLTGLANRAMFQELVNRAIATHKREGEKFSIFFIDLDKFKSVNDSYGHEFGDQLLVRVAEKLKAVCRASDIAARWAGDEFVMLIEQQGSNRSAITVAEKIVNSISKPITIFDNLLSVTCSVGIASYPLDSQSADVLIKQADNAMYQAKQDGRNLFRFFTKEMNDAMQERLRLERDLMRALDEDEFVLHFQPQISIKSGEVYGVEALIRWRHPEKGLLLPDQFLSVAEENGQIKDIGAWVIKQAVESIARWRSQEGETLPVAINISAVQFKDPALVSILHSAITATGVPAESIVLEITESDLLDDGAPVMNHIHALKSLGVSIALDDFGTGYSSLAYLKKLPIDVLKIDRSFLVDATDDKASAHIISAIIELSHALNLDVVAEGIENEAQLELLKLEDCDKAQGFFLAEPMDFNDLSQWFDTHNVLPFKRHSL